jgi:hypothetical protein
MAFKLVHENNRGSFKLKLNREVSKQEMDQICQLADNLLSGGSCFQQPEPVVYGPHQQDAYSNAYNITTPTNPSQTKLGEFPVTSINMGTYKEPEDGVRIKMLHFIELGRIPAFKAFKEATGIAVYGCKDIIYGNYPCPILTLETARTILEKFKALNIYAKIVPAHDLDA